MKTDWTLLLMPAGAVALVIVVLVTVAIVIRRPRSADYTRTTVDGVECIVFRGIYKGGISCNWEQYNRDRHEQRSKP